MRDVELKRRKPAEDQNGGEHPYTQEVAAITLARYHLCYWETMCARGTRCSGSAFTLWAENVGAAKSITKETPNSLTLYREMETLRVASTGHHVNEQ